MQRQLGIVQAFQWLAEWLIFVRRWRILSLKYVTYYILYFLFRLVKHFLGIVDVHHLYNKFFGKVCTFVRKHHTCVLGWRKIYFLKMTTTTTKPACEMTYLRSSIPVATWQLFIPQIMPGSENLENHQSAA